MNISPLGLRKAVLRGLRVPVVALVSSISTLLAGLRAAEPPAEDKTHALFMGLDLSVEHEKTFHRVKDVSGDSFVITAKAAPVFLPVNRASRNLRVNNVLKLTSVSASITNLTSKRVYTARADPKMRRMVEMNRAMASMDDAQSLAIDKAAALSQATSGINTGDQDISGSGGAAHADWQEANARATAAAFDSAQTSSTLANSYLTSSAFVEGRTQDDLAKELFDGIEATFELSSETPLNNPYVLLVARFREPRAPVSTARNWIYAESLDPISSTPVKFHVMKGGFPPGYVLEDFQVHIYNRGEEVATNVSSKRVSLTREEAFEYVMIQYVSAHKGATLPAAPAMGKLPPDFNARLTGGQFNQTYYVKVTKDGTANGAYMDESCMQKIEDPYLESVVNSIRFTPALEKGKPVDAVTRLKLNDLPH
jgi:hypothetical protein